MFEQAHVPVNCAARNRILIIHDRPPLQPLPVFAASTNRNSFFWSVRIRAAYTSPSYCEEEESIQDILHAH